MRKKSVAGSLALPAVVPRLKNAAASLALPVAVQNNSRS
jgi:hypothetical protein